MVFVVSIFTRREETCKKVSIYQLKQFILFKILSSYLVCVFAYYKFRSIYTSKVQIVNFNTFYCNEHLSGTRDLRAVSPASEMEILDRKTDQKSFARQSRDVDIGTADKNDKVSKLFVPSHHAVSSRSVKTYFCRFQSRSCAILLNFFKTPIAQS